MSLANRKGNVVHVVHANDESLPLCKVAPPVNVPIGWDTIIITLACIAIFVALAGALRDEAAKSTGYTEDVLSCLAGTFSTTAAVALFALIVGFILPDEATDAMKAVRKKIWG